MPNNSYRDLFCPTLPVCACKSEQHGNCPHPVAWAVNLNDNEMFLCERCFANAQIGTFGPSVKILAAIRIQTTNA